jgi:uncharacterized protein YhfF
MAWVRCRVQPFGPAIQLVFSIPPHRPNPEHRAHIGKMMVMLNGSGTPAAVLETVELKTRRFGEVDEAFAFDEGEGDRTLRPEAHHRYFTRQGTFSPDMLLWCERFRVVARLLHSNSETARAGR